MLKKLNETFKKEYFIVYFSLMLRGFANGGLNPILPLFFRSLGIKISSYGFLMGIRSLAMVFCEMYFGILSDRIGNERMVAIAFFSLTLLTTGYTFSNQLAFLFLLQFVWGIGSTALAPTYKSMVSKVAVSGHIGAFLGMYVTIMTLGTVAGELSCTAIVQVFGYIPAFYFISFVFFLAGLIVSCSNNLKRIKFILPNLRLPKISRIRMETIKTFTNSFIFDKRFIGMYIAAITYAGGMGMIRLFLPIIIAEKFGASVFQIGIIYMIMSSFNVLTSPLSGFLSDKFGRIKILFLGFALFFAFGLISLGIKNLNELILVVAGLGLSQGLVHPSEMAIMADLIPKNSWGTIQGIHGTFQDIGGVIFPIISSTVWVALGPMAIFPIAGTIQILNLIILLSLRNLIKKDIART